VGVVGLAVFGERQSRPPVRVEPPWRRPRQELGAAPAGPDGARATQDAPRSAPAPESAEGGTARLEQRRGLGTEFGEEHLSHVDAVAFERESARPDALLTLRYDDRRGLLALGIDVDRRLARGDDAWMRETAQPFPASPGYADPPPGWRR
jgi:hypothetical protein